ncbi:glycine cleavage system protein GcvH [Slackia piriformis]|nr:glycine cleavage system protein GcvH [Slackia piriformis]
MNIPENLHYTETHEWCLLEGGIARIGITDYAQNELGDIVFVNLPEVGDEVVAGESFADVESVKAVSEVVSPVNGTVAEVNEELLDNPALVNEGAYDAWLIRVEGAEIGMDVMDAAGYAAFCE